MHRKDKTDSGIELVGVQKTHYVQTSLGSRCWTTMSDGQRRRTVMVHPTSEGLVINLKEGEFVMVNEFTICGIIPD